MRGLDNGGTPAEGGRASRISRPVRAQDGTPVAERKSDRRAGLPPSPPANAPLVVYVAVIYNMAMNGRVGEAPRGLRRLPVGCRQSRKNMGSSSGYSRGMRGDFL